MDENNQNSNEYTGEYGNSVEGTAPNQDTTYSYSYREHPDQATQSGDYRATDNGNATDNTVGGETQNDYARETQQTETEQNAQDGFTQAGAQTQESQSSFQQAGTQNQQHSPQGAAPQPKKPKSSFGKKVAVCAACAVVFGIVAAVCFEGVCYFSNKVLGVNLQAVSTQLNYTTDDVNYTQAATNSAIGVADVSGIAENSMPSIVAITSTQEGENYYDLFGQYYQGKDTASCGSGFIVGKNDNELLIATNNHVIDGAKTISVQFIDDEVYEATAKGTDSSADLAVIAVKLKDIKQSSLERIKVAKLGDSSECKVGEMVVAIGNALGYGQSVTVGYVSAKDREITESSDDQSASDSSGNTLKVIQTDAAINPGNSGGALMNMKGEVIGINSAKIADASVEGVGYAIPISEATPIIDELMDKEVLTEDQKGYLGISGRTVSDEAASFDMPTGVYVSEVAKGGAAAEASIQKGDIITSINDIKVTTIESLKEKANSYKKGTTVTIKIQRNENGTYQEKTVKVKLQGPSSLSSLPDSTAGAGNNQDNGNSGDGNSNNGNSGNSGNNGSDKDGSNDGNNGFGGFGGLFPGFN